MIFCTLDIHVLLLLKQLLRIYAHLQAVLKMTLVLLIQETHFGNAVQQENRQYKLIYHIATIVHYQVCV